MKKLNILTTTLFFAMVLFSCQQNENPSEQNPISEKKLSSDLRQKTQQSLEEHSDTVEMAICKIVDSTLSAEADRMLPWVYEKNAIIDIRFEEYDYLAYLQKCWELNNTLNRADSISERKLLKLFAASPYAFSKEFWDIRQLWQLLHYEQMDGDDHNTEHNLDEIAKKNHLSDFLKRYKKLYRYENGSAGTFIVFTGSSRNISKWKALNAKGIKTYEDLKRKAILADSSLNNAVFKNYHWQRDNLFKKPKKQDNALVLHSI